MTKTIEEIIKELEKSPMFALSLSSKELFHSNFLAWLFEKCPESLKAVTGKEINYGALKKVYREKANIDIIIEYEKGLLVIENKVKDTVKKEQLDEYLKKVRKLEFETKTENAYKNKKIKFDEKQITFIILSLFKAGEDVEKSNPWIPLSYSELAERLEFIKILGNNPTHQAILDDYKKMINLLGQLADELPCDKNYWFDKKNIMEQLDSIRFDHVYKKYLAAKFLDKIIGHPNFCEDNKFERNRDYIEKPCPDLIFLHGAGITNNTPLVHLGYSKNGIVVGIQIQGNQYRRFIEAKIFNQYIKGKKRKEKEYTALEKMLLELPENYKWLERSKESLCSYAPYFVYRYDKIEEKDYHNLKELIIADLTKARNLIENDDFVRYFVVPK